MSSLPAAFAANNRNARLPAGFAVKQSQRDYLILDCFIAPALVQRMGVLFDVDRDERVLDVLSAAHYSCPNVRANILCLAETQGRIAVYYGCPLTIDEARRKLSEASYRALAPADRWHVDIVLVPVREGLLDRTRLDEQHPLQAAPARFALGLIGAKS